MIHQIRVIYGDTDKMGVVYYANYLRYFEAARAAWFRDLGYSNKDLEAWGVALPVVEAHCNYRNPAHYEDLLDVHVDVTEARGASLRFAYRIERQGTVLAEGYTRHAAIDAEGRLRRFPPPMRDLLARVTVQTPDPEEPSGD